MGRFKEKGETKGILRRKKGVGMEGGEKADAEEAQRQVSGPGGEASGRSGQALVQNIKKMEARARRHEGRPPASDLPLRSGGRGLHPPGVACSVPTPVSSQAGARSKGTHVGAGAAHPTPRRAGQGGRGVLYLRPCKKTHAVRLHEAFWVPCWGKRCCAGDFALARPARFYCQRLQDRGGKVYLSG